MIIPVISMLATKTMERLRSLLPYHAKEAAFRKVSEWVGGWAGEGVSGCVGEWVGGWVSV